MDTKGSPVCLIKSIPWRQYNPFADENGINVIAFMFGSSQSQEYDKIILNFSFIHIALKKRENLKHKICLELEVVSVISLISLDLVGFQSKCIVTPTDLSVYICKAIKPTMHNCGIQPFIINEMSFSQSFKTPPVGILLECLNDFENNRSIWVVIKCKIVLCFFTQ